MKAQAISIALLIASPVFSADNPLYQETLSAIERNNAVFFDKAKPRVKMVNNISDLSGIVYGLSDEIKNEYQSLPSYTISTPKSCYIHNAHYDEISHADPNKPLYDLFTFNARLPNSKNDIYWITFYHEYAHCLQNHTNNISYRDGLRRTLSARLSKSLKPSIDKAVNNAYESVADVFGLLMVQKDYLIHHQKAINHHERPTLNPSVYTFAMVRYMATEKGIDTANYQASSEIALWAINIFLKRPDILMAASDKDIYNLALLAVHQKFTFILSISELPISSYKANKSPINENSWITEYLLLSDIQEHAAQFFISHYSKKNIEWIEKLIDENNY